MKDVTINPKFESLIPKLSDDEFKQLEENILRDGITEPLVVWNGTLIDGHNRYKLAKKHGLDFETREMSFDSEDDAEIWIIKNQFGRRNLSTYDRGVLALKLKPAIAKKAERNLHLSDGKGCQKSDKVKPIDTKKEVAKLAGVSHDTIHRVEVIEAKGSDDLKQKVRSGEKSINEAYISVTPKKKTARQIENEAKERHAEFKAKKENGATVIDLQEVKEDARDVRIIGRSFCIEIMEAAKKLQNIMLTRNREDMDALLKTYPWEDRKRLLEIIDDTIRRLNFIRKELKAIK